MYSFSDLKYFISKRCLAYAAIAIVSLSFAAKTAVAAGSLDRSFGEGGKTVAYINGAEKLFDIAVQPDGKIVAAGGASPSGALWDFIVLRYNPDGSPDQEFGTGGRAIVSVVPGSDSANAVIVQPDGKIVVGGYAQNTGGSGDFAILRLNADGTPDEGFGTGGATIFSVGAGSDNVSGLALQTSANQTKIIAVGPSGTAPLKFAAIRLNPNGAVDTGFGTDGVSLVSIGGVQDNAADVVVDSAQKIVIGGSYRFDGGLGSFRDDFAVVRLNVDGALDPTFSGDGKLTTQFSSLSAIRSMQVVNIGGEDRYYASGITFRNSANDFAVVRYKADGSLDNTFTTSGRVITAVGTNEDQIHDSVVQPDGKLIVAGFSGNGANGTNKDLALIRYNVNGTIDTSFGSCGKIITHLGSTTDIAWGVALQQNGRVVAAGEVQNGSTSVDGVVVRYKPQGAASATTKDFDGDGREDVSVFRPQDGNWYLTCSCQGQRGVHFGQAGDIPVAADYDGDGKTDLAVYRAGTWDINRTSDGHLGVFRFGIAGDTPTVGDYDGDEKADVSVWRESEGMWYVLRSSDGQFTGRAAGGQGDKPVPADYDRDGRDDIAVYHAGEWWIDLSSTADQNFTVTQFGLASDIPLTGDFDGDGRDDLTVFRASEGMWYQQLSTAGYKGAKWGIETDNPVPADYDGDGRADLAVYRGGMWYIIESTTNTYIGVAWGLPSDLPAVK